MKLFKILTKGLFLSHRKLSTTETKKLNTLFSKIGLRSAEMLMLKAKIAKITCFYIFLHRNLRRMNKILINEVLDD